MKKGKNWVSRHPAATYCLCILAFLGLVFIAYYTAGELACAAVSFGIPAFAFAYVYGWENGRIDLLRKQAEQEKTGIQSQSEEVF